MNKDWKKEFDEKYMDKFSFEHWKNNGGNSPGQIKTFIQSLLDKKDKEIAETRDKMGDHIIELIDKLDQKDREWFERIINDAEKRKATVPIKIDGEDDSVPYAEFIIHNGITNNLNK